MANLKDTTISGNLAVTGAANINNGAQISGSDVILLNTGTGDSPALIFQRGTLSDNYNDWKIVDSGGFLRFQQRGISSTGWSDEVSFSTSGQIAATTFSGQLSGTISSETTATTQASTDNSTKVATTAFVKSVLPAGLPSVSSSDNGKVLMVVNGAWAAASLPVYNGGVI